MLTGDASLLYKHQHNTHILAVDFQSSSVLLDYIGDYELHFYYYLRYIYVVVRQTY